MSTPTLDDLRKASSVQYPLDQVPSEFDGPITSAEIKQDKLKNNCLFLKVSVGGDKEKIFTQKYTPTIITEFMNSLQALGFKSIPLNESLHWAKKKAGRSTFDRWYPTAKTDEKRHYTPRSVRR